MGRQKRRSTPPHTLSPFLPVSAKKLGRAALQKEKEGGQAADPPFCQHGEKKWAHLSKAATVTGSFWWRCPPQKERSSVEVLDCRLAWAVVSCHPPSVPLDRRGRFINGTPPPWHHHPHCSLLSRVFAPTDWFQARSKKSTFWISPLVKYFHLFPYLSLKACHVVLRCWALGSSHR